MRVWQGCGAAVLVALGLAFAADAAEEADAKQEQQRPERKSMMERFDGDGSGKVNLEEYKAGMAKMAEERFKALDADGDGELTEEELTKSRRSFRDRRAGGRRRAARGVKPEAPPTE